MSPWTGHPPEVVEGRVPGEARPVRHHGRHTSRGDYLPRAGESNPGWTETLLARRFGDTAVAAETRSTWSAMRMTSSSPARREVLLQREVQPLVEHFLSERGLELSHEKTRITHIEDGFDFLGQTVRRFPTARSC